MQHSESAAIDFSALEAQTEKDGSFDDRGFTDGDEALFAALDLLDRGSPVEADRLLTAALLAFPRDDRLWLAAGICRMRRGCHRAAVSAFEMSAWLSGDANAKELFYLCKANA